MKPSLPELDRRTLLIGGGIGVGLIVAFAAWPRANGSPLLASEGEQVFGSFIKIGRDGRVTVAVPQVETGQGVWTALPQIVADELGAAWETVAVEPAPLSGNYANPLAAAQGWLDGFGPVRRLRLDEEPMRITAGSTSVRAFEQPLRRAGATARALLIAAAAEKWNVDPGECDAVGGFVVCGGRRAALGELAERAAQMEPPAEAPLRTSGDRLAGQPLQRLDLPPKTDGSFRFAADVRLPGMLFASARLAPHGGRISIRSVPKRAPGVREIVAVDNWVAAIGDTWWAADRGLRDASIRVAAPQRADSAALDLLLDDALDNREADTLLSRGDYAAATAGSRSLTARYSAAAALHMGLEPLTATARWRDGRVELWAPTQAPEFTRRMVADAAGLSADAVILYPMPVGDQGGRAVEADAVPIAFELARRFDRPMQVALSPAASQNHDRPAPAALARLSALPSPAGGLAAWRMRIATADGMAASLARLAGAEPPKSLGSTALAGATPPYGIENVRIDAVPVPMPFLPGYMRGEPQRALTFFTESFVDEMARIAGIDPLAYRVAMLGGNPRLARCLTEAAARGGWDGGTRGSTLGLAATSAFGSHIALLADARIGEGQRIAVDRLVAVVDCGRPINPGLIAQQIEGGLIWGLGTATAPAPDFAAGMPLARPLGALRLPRMAQTPRIEVHLVRSSAEPGGINGLGPAVVAPAVANAIAAGTGKRLRALPLDPMSAA